MARATPYDPKNLATTSGITTQYVTNVSTADGFQRAYPDGQTLTELSPRGTKVQATTLAAWP
jgi:hypothetical protein